MKNMTGLVNSGIDVRDYKLCVSVDGIDYPSYYRWVDIPIKNQGNKPTCVPHAISELVEYHYLIETGHYQKFSTDYIYALRDEKSYKGKVGVKIRDGLRIISKYGDVLESTFSGNSYSTKDIYSKITQPELIKMADKSFKISKYYKVETENEMKYAVMFHGPVILSMKWYEHYHIKNGIYTYNKKNSSILHAVICVGWEKDHWILQNSYGKTWGDNKGYFKVPIKDSFKNLFKEVWGATEHINEIKPTKRKCAKFLNIVLNLFNKQ